MATADDSLEILLNRATDPSLPEEDWERIKEFCAKVNAELEGPLLSTRLIAHKIQSPQEREALYALSTLEACVKECGRYFHQEIGKFRFLNEIIKVVSPKYLGNRTTERVKKRCTEILYSWHRGLSHEPKISEAYKMLKTQNIIKDDPTYVDKDFFPFPRPKPRKADFEDDEKAKTLEKLLQSKNPEDLQAANRLIKNMVKEDAEKSEKRSQRINMLEEVSNKVKLLTEMMAQFSAASSREEKEMMKELYDNLEKQRPQLFRLASDCEENDNDGINDILEANDSVTRVMTLYKQTVEGEKPAGDYTPGAHDQSLLSDLGLEGAPRSAAPANPAASSALLENDFNNLVLGGDSIFNSTQSQPAAPLMQPSPFAMMGGVQAQGAAGFPQGPPPVYSAISHSVAPKPAVNNSAAANLLGSTPASTSTGKESSSSNLLGDLDILDKSLQDYKLNKESFPAKTAPSGKTPLNQLAPRSGATSSSTGDPPLPVITPLQPTLPSTSLFSSPVVPPQPTSITVGQVSQPPASNSSSSQGGAAADFTPLVSAPAEPKPPELLPLTDVFVPLEKIQPAPGVAPVAAYEKNGLKVVIHVAADRPRPDVLTLVVTSLSTCPTPVSGFAFQAAVPKTMKVKLQPPSASDFPPYNPILPPTAITQVMLVANPRKEKVRLKYKLMYSIDGTQTSDVGDIDGIPVQ